MIKIIGNVSTNQLSRISQIFAKYYIDEICFKEIIKYQNKKKGFFLAWMKYVWPHILNSMKLSSESFDLIPLQVESGSSQYLIESQHYYLENNKKWHRSGSYFD